LSYDLYNDPILGAALAYWRAKSGARAMPRRSDIEPTEIPRLLPNLQITEIVDGGKRIRYRLVGTAIVEAYANELTGKHYDEIFSGKRLRFIEAHYRTLCSEKRPILSRNRFFTDTHIDGRFCNRLMMPLSADGETVNQCLTAVTFEFPGLAYRWLGQWFRNDDQFDYDKSRIAIVE